MLLFFIRLTPYFFGVLLLVYFFKLIILQGKIRSLNSEQELRLREKYPEMTERDLKARRSEISSYLSHYLMKGFKRYIWLSAAIGAIVFLIAALAAS